MAYRWLFWYKVLLVCIVLTSGYILHLLFIEPNEVNKGKLPIYGDMLYNSEGYQKKDNMDIQRKAEPRKQVKDPTTLSKCPHKHFVFIKLMKCATETMGTILRRFALKNNLSVMLPRGKNIYLGWPYTLDKVDYRPSDAENPHMYHCLIEHAIYNSTIMTPLFPSDTKYITIIRHPWKQFKSSFHYFNVEKIAQVKSNTSLMHYVNNLESYETVYKSHEARTYRFCIPDGFSVTKNLMSHCLGMPTGFPVGHLDFQDSTKLAWEYIYNVLRTDFHLVMIVEYFHESLILLKRLMCWEFKDILYKRTNSDKYHYKTTEKEEAIHRKWSSADYILYDHFNQTFWEEVGKQSKDFYEEVAIFTKLQLQVTSFCNQFENKTIPHNKHTFNGKLTVHRTNYSEEFVWTEEDCNLLKSDLLESLKQKYNKNIYSRFGNTRKVNNDMKRVC